MSADTPPAVTDLLDAVRDAMEVPRPADLAHVTCQDRLRSRRAEYVCGVLVQITGNGDLDSGTRAVRSAPALLPVNYRVAGGGGR
ncbi:hypothetical protein [Nocardiopsis halophila]|uniref:hypothetical protein n=1 Tax=Nocardiopsis halophila TaxID=141692 RepID=UPI00034773CB|nr:hypothetical protein [Nocardiopsis halophila]